MKGKSFVALFFTVSVLMLWAGSVFGEAIDWMSAEEQINQMGAIFDMLEEQEKQKEIEALRQQKQLLQEQNQEQQKLLSKHREASKTTLMEAAKHEDVAVLQRLLNSGEQLNAKDYDGDTALTYAVRENTDEVVRFLIDSGAYVNDRTLDAAIARKDTEILHRVLRNGFDRETLNRALLKVFSRHTNFGVIEMLLHAGADINCKDSAGNTPLIALLRAFKYSASSINPEFVKAMIDAGANVNVHDSAGVTPLMYAVDHEPVAVVRVLLGAGADIHARDRQGKTVLMYAAENNTPSVVDMLLDAGADVDAKDMDGRKAVDYAKPAYFGWKGGNSKLKGSGAFERLGKSGRWVKFIW